MSKNTNDGLTRSGTGCFIAVPIWQQWASKGLTTTDGETDRQTGDNWIMDNQCLSPLQHCLTQHSRRDERIVQLVCTNVSVQMYKSNKTQSTYERWRPSAVHGAYRLPKHTAWACRPLSV